MKSKYTVFRRNKNLSYISYFLYKNVSQRHISYNNAPLLVTTIMNYNNDRNSTFLCYLWPQVTLNDLANVLKAHIMSFYLRSQDSSPQRWAFKSWSNLDRFLAIFPLLLFSRKNIDKSVNYLYNFTLVT